MSETFTCPLCTKTSYHPEDAKHGYCGRCKAFTRGRANLLPPEPRSWDVLNGKCGWGVADDVRCDKPADHDPPHRAHDPSGSGDWIEFDDAGQVTDRGKGAAAALLDSLVGSPSPLVLREPRYEEERDVATLRPLMVALGIIGLVVGLGTIVWAVWG